MNDIKRVAPFFILSVSFFGSLSAQSIPDGVNRFKNPYFNSATAGLDKEAGRGIWVADNPDLDQDGKPEILVTEYSGGGRVFVFEVVDNDSLEFVWSSKVLAEGVLGGGLTPRSVTTGDFDNDSHMEIIFAIGYSFSDSLEAANRGIYIYEHTGLDNDYGTEPAYVIKYEDIDTLFSQVNVGKTESGLQVLDVDGDGKNEMLFPPRAFGEFGVANLYILEVDSGTFENSDALVEVEFIYSGMAFALADSTDGYVPVGTAFGNVDSDAPDEIVVAGWTNIAQGAGLGFLEVSGIDTYTPGSVLPIADFNAFVVKAKPLIIDVNGSPTIYVQGRESPSKLWVVNNIVDDQLVDQTNLTEVFDGLGGFSIWDWGDQDHGTGSDGFDLYLSIDNGNGFGKQIVDLEYDGSGDPASPASYSLDTLSFDLGEFFDSTDGLFDDIYTRPGLDLDRDGAREIVVSYKGSFNDVLNGQSFTENTFNVFVFEWGQEVNVAWCDSNLGRPAGARDTVFVCVGDITGLDIISYQLIVTFDETVLNADGAISTGTLSEGFGPPTANTVVDGQITVGGFGTTPLAGEGQLVGLVFDVVGNAGAVTDLCVQSVLFNAGDPAASVLVPCCPYNVINEFDISGSVTYCPTGGAVENTTLTLSGGASDNRLTDTNGAYIFENQTGGVNYTVTPSKTDDINLFVISCFDAALAARIAVGLDQADHCDSLAADVDEDGNIFTFDAALICRNAVGLPPFGESDKTGEWRFEPVSRSYTPLEADQSNQGFTGSLLGDVDGNWTPASGGGAMLAKGQASRVRLLNESGSGENGREIRTVVRFDGSTSASAFEFQHVYDPEVLRYKESIGIPDTWELFTNSSEVGLLRLGMFSTSALSHATDLIRVRWEVLQERENTEVRLERTLVNSEPQAVTVLAPQLQRQVPTKFALHQNYPNPFNPETNIDYELPEPVEVRLTIYNINGQEVLTLVDTNKKAGFHSVIWGGDDKDGRHVASGIYVYRIEAGDFIDTMKLTLLR